LLINTTFPPKQWREEGQEAKTRHFGIVEIGGGWSSCSMYFVKDCNLGQNKKEQLTPFPKRMMKELIRAILASLKSGEGWPRFSICFIVATGEQSLELVFLRAT